MQTFVDGERVYASRRLNARRPPYGPSAVMLAVVIASAAIQIEPAGALNEWAAARRGLPMEIAAVATR